MTKIVYHYFPLKARGEGCRLLLAYGGEEFEDKRITHAEWPSYQPSKRQMALLEIFIDLIEAVCGGSGINWFEETPFGQMPVLEIDGKQYAQSYAIARYLGRRYGLAGADIEEDLEIDQNVNFVTDFYDKARDVKLEYDLVFKAKKHEEYTKNVYPRMLEKMDALLKASNGYVACSRLTWADFVFAGMYDYLKYVMQNPDLDSQYPRLKELQQTVYSLPKVKAWADSVPAYNYPY